MTNKRLKHCKWNGMNWLWIRTFKWLLNKLSRDEICVANFIPPCKWCKSGCFFNVATSHGLSLLYLALNYMFYIYRQLLRSRQLGGLVLGVSLRWKASKLQYVSSRYILAPNIFLCSHSYCFIGTLFSVTKQAQQSCGVSWSNGYCICFITAWPQGTEDRIPVEARIYINYMFG